MLFLKNTQDRGNIMILIHVAGKNCCLCSQSNILTMELKEWKIGQIESLLVHIAVNGATVLIPITIIILACFTVQSLLLCSSFHLYSQQFFSFIFAFLLQACQTTPGLILTPFNIALALSIAQIHRFEETVSFCYE